MSVSAGFSRAAPAPVGRATVDAEFDVQAGIGFVAVQGAPPGTLLVLGDADGTEVARGTVDRLGSLIFRDLDQGRSFTVRGKVGTKVAGSDPVLDQAVAMYPRLEAFLQQRIDESESYESAVEKLHALFGTTP